MFSRNVTKKWQEEVARTAAISALGNNQLEKFPLRQLQILTDKALQESNTTHYDRDRFLANLIGSDHGHPRPYRVRLVACLHLLSEPEAFRLLRDVRPDPQADSKFCRQDIILYLQCLVLASIACRTICPETCWAAATALHQFELQLDPGKELEPRRVLRSVIPLVWAAGDPGATSILPPKFVQTVLKEFSFRENVSRALEDLVSRRRWLQALDFASELRHAHRAPRDISDQRSVEWLLVFIFGPKYAGWIKWRPDVERLQLWETTLGEKYHQGLYPFFELEGPDLAECGGQTSLFRHSQPGSFACLLHVPRVGHEIRGILDHLLETLDACIRLGPASVKFLSYVCLGLGDLAPERIEWVVAAVDIGQDSAALKLQMLVECFRSQPPGTYQVSPLLKALPVIGCSWRLQHYFVEFVRDIKNLQETFYVSQEYFCFLLTQGSAERWAYTILDLVAALMAARWLHDKLGDNFIRMLRDIPNKDVVSSHFQRLRLSSGDLQDQYRDLLAFQVGGCLREGVAVESLPDAPILDPVWSLKLDADRDQLRTAVREICGLESRMAKDCILQAVKESDMDVRQLNRHLGSVTDINCVNLAVYLGVRQNTSAPCVWRDLLVYMMRLLPLGLFDRCAVLLGSSTWERWIRALEILLRGDFPSLTGQLGFTGEDIARVTREKRASDVGRTQSVRSYGSSGYGSSDMSFHKGF